MARKEFETLTPQMFYILLSLYEPLCGLEIMEKVNEMTEGDVSVGAGTLYALLPRFENIGYIQLLKEIKWPIFLINDSFLQEQIMSACENKIDEKATSNIITSYFTDDVLDIMEDDWTSCSLINEQRIPILKEAILMHRNSYYYASTSILMCQIYGIASDIINLAKDNGLELNDENKNMLSEQYNIDKKNIDKEKGKLI